jgi:hypothetical protein
MGKQSKQKHKIIQTDLERIIGKKNTEAQTTKKKLRTIQTDRQTEKISLIKKKTVQEIRKFEKHWMYLFNSYALLLGFI